MTNLPDMSNVLDEWLQPIVLKTVSVTSVDFVETESVIKSNIQAVVQPAEKDKLNTESIDWSLEYQTIHSKTQIVEGQFFEYGGKDYKIISVMPYGDYGYYECVGEETKRTLL
jgi:hypothetical protein